MRYVISDIHGCMDEFLALLDKIHLTKDDHLYILGDILDRGYDPIGVARDVMKRQNVTFLLGNHELFLLYFAEHLGLDSLDFRNDEEIESFKMWLMDGGIPTMEGFLKLEDSEKEELLNFLRKAKTYETLSHDHKNFFLSHAGVPSNFTGPPMEQYDWYEFVAGRMDYKRRYSPDENTYIISGHTPTPLIREDKCAKIFQNLGHIVIDCGAVFGGRLAAYCIETGEITYVNGPKKKGKKG